MPARHSIARIGTLTALLALGSCGGGGGGGGEAPQADASCNFRAAEFVGVCSGFPDAGNLDWQAGGDGGGGAGDGGGASGDGGVGAGGDFGQFRNVTISVFKEDGTLLGSAPTDGIKGMVTIRPGAAYRGALRLELRGGPTAEYFEEGKNRFVPFPADRVIRVIVPRVDKNIGITAFTEAAYQLLTQGSAAESAGANPTPAQILAANQRVARTLNEHFPKALEVDDITRLPFIKSDRVLQGAIADDKRGIYGVVSGAFSKQAAVHNSASDTPTLDAAAQLAEDLRDGLLDGRNGNAPAAPAARRTYDPQTLTGELTSALAHQAERFGNDRIKATLPELLNYGSTRYQGYLFDGSITKNRSAQSVVAGWLAGNADGRRVGDVLRKSLPAGQSALTMIGNFGHGGAFFKIDSTDTTATPVYRVYALGDNVNGELGTGDRTDTNRALVELTLPGPLTHAAGGIAHTVFRLADGRVFAVGDNTFGQLGQGVDGNTLPNSTALLQVNLPAAAGGAVNVAATSVASYALMADGSIYTWGSNGGFGLLGNGQADGLQTTPALVAGLTDVVQISARDNDVVVLRRDQSLLQWGSHPADVNAYTDGDVSGAYRGGRLVPTPVTGLPATVTLADGRQVPMQVRKVLTEQGLFAVLLNNGHVYNWGVHFDLSAKAVLRDLSAARVLGLPPLRDMMPGGFVGYGARPFDRLTAMGVDYRGGMWKVRGRVAERFEPSDPTAQRRPQTEAPRSSTCATCHVFLEQALETLRERQLAEAVVPASAAVCLPPTNVHQAPGGASFIHAQTECIQCHNPAQLNPAVPGLMAPAFAATGGWPNCNKPGNLPSRQNVPATPITAVCSIPVGHAFTPPGTVCATCHNSVAARALQDLVPPCIQPGGATLPTLATTARIVAVKNGALADIADGAYSRDTTARLGGTLSAALSSTQTLAVTRSGTLLGAATVSGTDWTYVDTAAPQGTVSYTVRVVQSGGFGAASNVYTVRVDSVPPAVTVSSTLVTDRIFGAVSDNGFATDGLPTVSGALSGAAANGDGVQVLRNGLVLGNAALTTTGVGSTWTYTETVPLTVGTYTYSARVADAAGNTSAAGASRSVNLISGVGGATIGNVFNDASAAIPPGSASSDTTPRLTGTLSAALPSGHVVRVLRGNANLGAAPVSAGLATVSAQTWTFTDTAPQGLARYTVRVEADVVLGAASSEYAFTVDSLAPAQTAAVTLISDRFVGGLAPGASTSDQAPVIAGTLSAVLAGDEQLRLQRTNTGTGAVVTVTVPLIGTNWSYPEPNLLSPGTYSYHAQVVDAAGNTGTLSAALTVAVNLSALPLPDVGATLDTVGGFAVASLPGVIGTNTPVLTGTIARALNSVTDEVLRIYRGGAPVGTATVAPGATGWTYTNSLLAEGGPYTFFARVEQRNNSAVFGASSVTASVSIDSVAPAQTLTMSIVDDNGVAVNGSNSSDTTPRLQGTLSGILAAGEAVEVVRTGGAGTVTRDATVVGTAWSLQEVSALSLTAYTYTVRVRDAANNRGSSTVQTVTLIAPLPSTTISVVYSAGLAAPRADGTVVNPGGAIADATPTVRGTLSAALASGASVRLYRVGTGASIGTATLGVGNDWSFLDANVGQGARTYTARVENGSAYGSTSSAYSVTVDTVAPAQTFATVTGRTTVMPNDTVAGGTPPNDALTSGGLTDDPAPELRVQLGAALASGETLVLRRNGVVVNPAGTTSCGANCLLVDVPATVALPAPLATPTTIGVPTAPQGYTFSVVDAAGNEGASTPAFNIVFGYFACDPVRAALLATHPQFLATTNCTSCHTTTNPANPTPSGTLVAAPATQLPNLKPATYWCRRP